MSLNSFRNIVKNLTSLVNQCTDVVDVISDYGNYYGFEIIQSVLIKNLEHTELPSDICQISDDDHIFLSYTHANSVYRYNSRGEQIWHLKIKSPLQLCAGENQIFVVSYSSNMIYVISFNGIIKRRIQTRRPIAITFDSIRKHLVVFSSLFLGAFDLNGKNIWTRNQQGFRCNKFFLTFDKKTNNIILSCRLFSASIFFVYNYNGALLNQFIDNNNAMIVTPAIQTISQSEFIVICEGNPDRHPSFAEGEPEPIKNMASIFKKKSQKLNDDDDAVFDEIYGAFQTYLCIFKHDGTLRRMEKLCFKNCVFNNGLDDKLIFADGRHIHFVC